MAKAEKMLAHRLQPGGLYDPANMPLLHHINQALRAHSLFRLDVDYMIKDGEVVIVDEFTGRLMPGRRWSDGLHQAVEAKEKVKIERENQTLATVTFQNYFRKYKKLSGMTGTADTEAEEFDKIYKLDVMVIPTNRALRRIEEPDMVYRTEQREVRSDRQRHPREAGAGAAGAGRHGVDREVGAALEAAEAARHQARRPQREVPRAGSRDRRAGRAARPPSRSRPTWPAAAPTSCSAATPSSWRGSRRSPTKSPNGCRRARRSSSTTRSSSTSSISTTSIACRGQSTSGSCGASSAQTDAEHDEVVGLGGLHIIAHRAARGAPHRQPAARPRRPPGRSRLVALLPVARRRPDADLRVGPHLRADAAARDGGRRPDRAQDGDQAPSSAPRSRSRRRTSPSASTCSSTTT